MFIHFLFAFICQFFESHHRLSSVSYYCYYSKRSFLLKEEKGWVVLSLQNELMDFVRERFRDRDEKIEATQNVDRLVMIFCGWERRKWKKQCCERKARKRQDINNSCQSWVKKSLQTRDVKSCQDAKKKRWDKFPWKREPFCFLLLFCLLPHLPSPSSSSSSPQRVTQLNAYTLSLASPPFFFFLNFFPHSYLVTSSTLITGLEKPCPA